MLTPEEIMEVEIIFQIKDPMERSKRMGQFMDLGSEGRELLFKGRRKLAGQVPAILLTEEKGSNDVCPI